MGILQRASSSIPTQVTIINYRVFPLSTLPHHTPDKQRLSSLAQKGNDEMGASTKVAAERAIQNLNKCAAYCMNEIDCRRTQVLQYFGENFPPEKCNSTCDNCRRGTGAVSWEDVTEQAQIIVKVVSALAEAKLPKLTLHVLRTLFSNSKEKKLERYRAALDRMRVASEVVDSAGKIASKSLCEKILYGMVVSEYLREDSEMTASSFTAAYVSVGSQADSLLAGMGRLSICQHVKVPRRISRSVVTEDIEEDELPLSGEVFSSQTLPSPASNTAQRVSTTFVKSHAGATVCPSKQPWEAKRSGKLGLKTKSIPDPVIVDRRTRHIVEESDDDDFDTSVSQKSRGANVPTVDLTSTNRHSHNNQFDSGLESEISPEISLKTNPRTKTQDLGDDSVLNIKQRNALRSWLSDYRRRQSHSPTFLPEHFLSCSCCRWDWYWNYLNNSTLAEMTRKVPLSTEALMNIGGIGEQKVKRHGKHIVATIWSFLQRNNLLSLFPDQELSNDHPPYEIPLCPTWRDPMSSEAEMIRTASTPKHESPIKGSVKSPDQKHSPSFTSSSSYLPYSGFNSSSNPEPLFESPPPPRPPSAPGELSAGLYTFHSRPGAPSNLIQRFNSPSLSSPLHSVSTATGLKGNNQGQSLSVNEHPYSRYLNQRSVSGDRGNKRPSPGASEDESSSIRRRVSEINDIVPTDFMVSPDN
jgi:superfamily II DNA helicase RecQ